MLGVFRSYVIFLVGLACTSQVRSDWILVKPCFNNDSIIPTGTYSPGYCQSYAGQASYGECSKDEKTWTTYSCDGYDCSRNCNDAFDTPMNQCIDGYFSTCTTANKPDVTKGFGSDAVSLELHNTENCAGNPYNIYATEKDACINYSPQNTWYNSFKVTCTSNGSKAKLSLFLHRNCADLSATYVMPTNNCTTDPDILGGLPVLARCF